MKRANTRTMIAVLGLLGLLLATGFSTAADSPEQLIRAKLQQARPDLKVEKVQASVADGLYEVQLQAGPMLYVTEDGDFFVLGDMYGVSVTGITNLSEQQRDIKRRELLADVEREDMIIFAAEGERRASVTVFTDVDCFYCQKLHKEVPMMNKAGIEVRYLAYPRAGVGSDSYRKLASAWCDKDPQQAITTLKIPRSIPDNVCAGNPVADQFMLGQQAGVNGTPALVLESGKMVPGYVSAAELQDRLGL
ncbi:MAG: DsbC family protein [Halieaceae bacterium]